MALQVKFKLLICMAFIPKSVPAIGSGLIIMIAHQDYLTDIEKCEKAILESCWCQKWWPFAI